MLPDERNGLGSLPPVLLGAGLMINELKSGDRMGAIKELVDRLHASGCVTDSLGFLQSVLDREDLESTVLGSGVAFPHARSRSVARLGLAVGNSPDGVAFYSDLYPEPVHTVCLLAVPTVGQEGYLSLLGRLAQLFQSGDFRSHLQACASPDQMSQLIEQNLPESTQGLYSTQGQRS
jgi:mannitol/fructose-specific phosphotransferase system IIA component (Ntr-type)